MLGIALDEFGNFSTAVEGRPGGTATTNPNTVSIRGPGNGTSSTLVTAPSGTGSFPNYNLLFRSATLSSTVLVPQPNAVTRPTGSNVRHAIINFDMSDIAHSNAYVGVKILDGTGTVLAIPCTNQNVGAGLVNYFGAGNVPTSFEVALTSGTGGDKNTHEVQNLVVTNAAPADSFAPLSTVTVTVNVNPSSAGLATGGGTQTIGSNDVLTATAFQGWRFIGWSDGTTNSSRNITVATNATYTADFVPWTSRFFFQDSAGTVASWEVDTNGTYQYYTIIGEAGRWVLCTAGDIDGDGTSDLLFQLPDGKYGVWLLNPDNTIKSAYYVATTDQWKVRACADYEGIGQPQLFFQHTNGAVAYWHITNTGAYIDDVVLSTNTYPWQLKAAVDADGDGKADLFWQRNDGFVAAWFHNPDGSIRGQVIGPETVWDLRAGTDIDNDGSGDLLWQTPDGMIGGWFMNTNGTPRAASYWYSTLPDWKLKAAGHY